MMAGSGLLQSDREELKAANRLVLEADNRVLQSDREELKDEVPRISRHKVLASIGP